MDRYANFGYRMVTANALRHPDRLALAYAGTHHLTFADLESRSNRMAHALLAAGIAPGDRVASLLDDTLNVMDVYLAESKIGSVIAALNPFWRPALMQNV